MDVAPAVLTYFAYIVCVFLGHGSGEMFAQGVDCVAVWRFKQKLVFTGRSEDWMSKVSTRTFGRTSDDNSAVCGIC